MHIKRSTVNDLTYLFRASRAARPVLLLGAGASFRSGVPMAKDCVFKIAQASYARHMKGQDWHTYQPRMTDWLPYLQSQSWFITGESNLGNNFPLAVEHLLYPQEFRREFMTDLIKPPHGINAGYHHLANLMLRGLCHTVLTANFDSLIADALRDKGPHVRDIVEINRTADDLVRFNRYNRYQVVYLHGAVEYYRDKNLTEETRRLDKPLVTLLRPLLKDSPLVVVGYRGYELSIMEHLLSEGIKECENYRHGIYWCVRRGESPHEHVEQLAERIHPNLSIVEIDGFDELLAELDSELQSDAAYLPGTHSGHPGATATAPTCFDQELAEGCTLDDLDQNLILSTLTDYCKRLSIPAVDGRNYVSFLSEQGFVVKDEHEKLIPTKGAYLLFGKDVSDRIPHASVTLTTGGKKRTVVTGNLLEQFSALLGLLTVAPFNPTLRVKGNRDAEEKPAYPERAVVELLVNLLVHRDYTQAQFSEIEHTAGVSLRFTNPGGLLPKVRSRVQMSPDGKFQPLRNVTELRNPLLADIFYGLHRMDKQGSGLADVQELMVEHGGLSEFAVGTANEAVIATLIQPIQKTPDSSRTARRMTPTETYVTNLVPFAVMPGFVYRMPLKDKYQEGKLLYDNTRDPNRFPLFIRNAGEMISFSDLSYFPYMTDEVGYSDQIKEKTFSDFITNLADETTNEVNRRLVVWLLGKHIERFLEYRAGCAMQIEFRRKRAYFRLEEGKDKHVITYDGRLRRGVKRTVVISRNEGKYFENEGIAYQIVQFEDCWAVQLKPFYMFTRTDGVTPLPSFVRTRKSTKRIKFDRNRNVDDDLTFWIRYLSEGQPIINLGGFGVEDLILNADYLCADIPLRAGSGVGSTAT